MDRVSAIKIYYYYYIYLYKIRNRFRTIHPAALSNIIECPCNKYA